VLSLYLSALETENERDRMTKIYDEHKHVLTMYARKMLKSEDLAEDAVHATFLVVTENKDKYFHLDKRNFRFLSVSIVKRKCIDILRGHKQYADKPLNELEFYLESHEKPVVEQVIISSEYEAVRKHLRSLDEISRQVFLMKYYHNMSYAEIGEELCMTHKQIDNKLMRAKAKLKNLMGKEVTDNE